MSTAITDTDRLLFLWSLVTDEHGWGFDVTWNPQFDFVVIRNRLGDYLTSEPMVEKDGDEGDEEGRTFRKAIDTLINERNKQKANT
jgi:hypothetical protein